jgi:hypothetical protein
MDDVRPPVEDHIIGDGGADVRETSAKERLMAARFDMPDELEAFWDKTIAEIRRQPARATPQN